MSVSLDDKVPKPVIILAMNFAKRYDSDDPVILVQTPVILMRAVMLHPEWAQAFFAMAPIEVQQLMTEAANAFVKANPVEAVS